MSGPSPANLFSVFPEELSARLFAHAKPAKLAADQVLFVAGDPGDGCYRVEQGLLKVSMIAPTGAERILAIVGPGAIVGELSTIDGLPRSASVSAVRDSQLSFISRAAFAAFAEENPEVYKHLVTLLAARLRDTDGVVAAGSFLPLKGRVARALLDLSEAFGQDVGRAASSFARRSARATSRRWPGSPAKTSAASSTTGFATSWSAGCRAITAWRTRPSSSAKRDVAATVSCR